MMTIYNISEVLFFHLLIHIQLSHEDILALCFGKTGRDCLYLSAAPTVMLPADDGEGSLTGDAGVTGFVRDPVRRVYMEGTRDS